jgi:methylenetetrahydrofolate--tRNA-(uracil-5-)-methyltransferase
MRCVPGVNDGVPSLTTVKMSKEPCVQGDRVTVVGGGLAGSEAAFQLARAGVPVRLVEMRPLRATAAHRTGRLAELVCSNSFRSDDALNNAVGLLHAEMRKLGSLIMAMGDRHQVPAGSALAVDRESFSADVEAALEAEPLVEIVRGELETMPGTDAGLHIVATGPLTGASLAHAIAAVTGEDQLAFFDAIAPIVYTDTVDFDVAWFQSRYDKPGPGGDGKDYINCPLSEDEYHAFVDALLAGDKHAFKGWETDTPYFAGCMPIEVMAERGRLTLAYGPLKPVGLTDPRTGERPFAVVQLRQDNALGTLYNMVGFQTKLAWGAQKPIFRMIPGLENAEFARLGGLHRNTFLNSPRLLDGELRLKARPNVRFAGQITGCEGYVESAAIGWLAARFAAAEFRGERASPPPPTTAHGALLAHLTGGADAETFQPMNVNFGLLPPSERRLKKTERKPWLARRALADLDGWLAATPAAA